MKKSRLLVVMLVMLFAASAYAQDSYREAVKDYWSQYTKGYLNQLDSVFKSTNKVWFQSGDLDLDQLADRYLEERLMDYMTDLFLPKVKELGVSEAALRENAALCSTPAGKTYMEHLQQLTEVMRADIASLIDHDNLTIKNGATSDPVQIKAGIDAGYVAKYKKVMESDLINFMEGSLDQYSNVATIIFKDNPNGLADLQNKIAGLKAWAIANLPAMTINAAYGIITEDDLDFVAKLQSLDTHKLLGLIPISDVDLMSMGTGIMMDYMEWMENQGAVVNEYMKEALIRMSKQGLGN